MLRKISFVRKLAGKEMYSVSTAKNSLFYILYLISHTVNASAISVNIQATQYTFTCSKSTIEALEKDVKYVQS